MNPLLSRLLTIATVGSFLLSLYLVYNHFQYKQATMDEARQRLQTMTKKAAGDLDAILRQIMTTADGIADDLSRGKLSTDAGAIKERLRRTLDDNGYIYSASLSFRPQALSPTSGLSSHLYQRPGNGIAYCRIESLYDYTAHGWFSKPMQEGKSQWIEPYYGVAGKTLLIAYSAVFSLKDPVTGRQAPAGVMVITVSLDEIRRIVESLDLGRSGYGAIVSGKGVYINHPNTEFVAGHKTIMEVARESKDQERFQLGERLVRGEVPSGIVSHWSNTTERESWLAFEPIPAAGWSLQNTFIKSDVLLNTEILRRQLIRLTIVIVLFFQLLILRLGRLRSWGLRRLWAASAVSALVFVLGIATLWELALSYDNTVAGNGDLLISQSTLDKGRKYFIDRSSIRHIEPPIFVPTGVNIESLRLSSDHIAVVTGHIWQRFSPGMPPDLAREFTFSSAEDVNVSLVEKHEDNGAEVYLWRFKAQVRELFLLNRYPLDREVIGIRILQKDTRHNVVLLPDITAYKLMNPSTLPGLDKELEIPGWTKEKSFFRLAANDSDVTFGRYKSILAENQPLLLFNVVVKRNFIDSFISNLTPLIVVAFMLFIVLMTTSCDEKTLERTKLGISLVVSSSSALFFVVVFSHIGVRQRIQAQDIFYLEYFYFFIYLTIMWVTFVSIIFAMAKDISLVQYRNNLLAKLVYWPFLLGGLFVTTVATFY